MDTLLNIRAFLATVDAGSLSGAARKLNVAPSVITKRVGRLEDEMGVPLFTRTTRRVELTDVGSRYVDRYRTLVRQIDAAVAGAKETATAVEGKLRIKCPTTLSVKYFGALIIEFLAEHKQTDIELMLMDRSVNPQEEGLDVAFGALPTTYPNVIDIPLCEYDRVLCAAPSYLETAGWPEHPRDLVNHDCLVLQATGPTWSFAGPDGPVSIDVKSRFSANDSQVLHDAVYGGHGIAIIAEHIARNAIEKGELIRLLPDFDVEALWLKAMIPQSKAQSPLVKTFLDWIRSRMQPRPPWAAS